MFFDEKFLKEEIRCDFLVDQKRKKIWSVELHLLEEFDRICQKYGLKYWAAFGTLLGAVRHNGFIPWDDDLDVVMMRPDYEKFRSVVQSELPEYYFFQDTFTDVIAFTFSKIRDSRTTAYESKFTDDANQGIYIDIFPLDTCFAEKNEKMHEVEKELFMAMMKPSCLVQQFHDDPKSILLPLDLLQDFIDADPREQMKQYETFLTNHFGESDLVGYLPDVFSFNGWRSPVGYYDSMEYVSFENTRIPIPGNSQEILKCIFGKDYMTPKQIAGAHVVEYFDPDLSYTEYIKQKEMSHGV